MNEVFKEHFKTIIGCILGILSAFVTLFLPSPIFDKGRYIPDNEIEQKIEKFIEKKTGIIVDLSPDGENKKKDESANKH